MAALCLPVIWPAILVAQTPVQSRGIPEPTPLRPAVATMQPDLLAPSLNRPSLPGAAPAKLPAEITESITHFDPMTVEVRQNNRHFQLWAGKEMLKDFGEHREHAWEARKLVTDLQLTDHGSVGTPQAVMEYWLSHGQPPPFTNASHNVVPLDAGTLRVDLSEGQYWLRDKDKQIFNFGLSAADAQLGLAVFHKYDFNELGIIGSPTPTMTYLLHDPHAKSSLPGKPASMRVQTLPQQTPNTALSLPVIGTVGTRVPFDPMRLEVHRAADGYHLTAGVRDLGSAGSDEYAARTVVHAAQHYPFTEYVRIGTGNFGFYLSRNQAPRGIPLGINHVAFSPQSLGVQQTGDQWRITDGKTTIAEGTGPASDAKLALGAIQHYQFNCLCDSGSFRFLARDR
jgi:hypothetical protein